MGIYIQYIYNKNCGVSFWTCLREILGDRVALFPITRKIWHILLQNLVCLSFVWCPNSTYNFRTIGLQLQILSYTAHCKNQQSFYHCSNGSIITNIYYWRDRLKSTILIGMFWNFNRCWGKLRNSHVKSLECVELFLFGLTLKIWVYHRFHIYLSILFCRISGSEQSSVDSLSFDTLMSKWVYHRFHIYLSILFWPVSGSEQSSVDTLSFETLMPKSIVQRYISLLMEHKRIILCGPSGTGKTFLAQKLAEYLVQR